MMDIKLDKLIIDKEKFTKIIERYNFAVDFVGESIAIIKSRHDTWQVELEYRDSKSQYEIRLNHMNKAKNFTVQNKERYHLQGYYKSYRDVMKSINNHDKGVDRNTNRRLPKGMKQVNKISNLFDMIENNAIPKLKPQHN